MNKDKKKSSEEQISIISEGALIEGKVTHAGTLVIVGTVSGEVLADRVIIKDKGHLIGTVTCRALIMEAGGLLDGNSVYLKKDDNRLT
ncbi:MAG: polymer-forming cytoskeletal protein [Deltaproteobacteria bacterium]|nr:polymer-forming cytoskeletal protein [Deltaproteobacteria bacterium]